MAISYQHRRLDTNEIFYIGIGKEKSRAYNDRNRNKYWKRIVNKTNYNVEILTDNLSWENAQEAEIQLIKLYGKKNLNNGTLCNMTDGGEGFFGGKHSDETKLKMKKSNKGFCQKAILNSLNTNSKKVIDIKTNIIYKSAVDACNHSKYSLSTIYRFLTGKYPNKTTLKYLDYDS